MNLLSKQMLIVKHDTFDKIYDDDRDYQCAYEVAYYHEFGRLPFDAYIVEHVEVVNGNAIFVHSDSERSS